MATLGMGAADIAYSAKGIDTLITEIKDRAQKIKNNVSTTSDNFVALETTLKENWSGADCDKYINDLKKAASNLSGSADDLANKLVNSLNNYKNEFNKMQNTTYGGVSVKRSI